VDANGNFYGTTISGGTRGYGIVFKLTPPASGSTVWRESIAHAFTGVGGDGYPDGGLIEYSLGTFYGTTSGQVPFGGTAFKIKM
jgi:uncharacterized repeat protein (TIGR03803 family)